MYSAHTLVMKQTANLITVFRIHSENRSKQTEVRGLAEALCAKISLRFRRPQSHYGSDGELKPNAPRYCCKRPDVDNYQTQRIWRVKFILDALQKAKVVEDDKFVCRVEVMKKWCDRADEKTEVELFVL